MANDKDEKEIVIHGFKGFNKDMTCRGFQYEIGKEYETAECEPCESGFHACENPLDVFSYYSPGESVFCKTEQGGEVKQHNSNSKIASTKIKIGLQLSILDYCKAAFEFVLSKCDVTKTKHATGYRSASSATGDQSASSATGYRSASSATGDRSASLATDDRSASLATGDQSASSATGNRSASLATGDQSASSATGNQSASSATGNQSASSATGNQSASSATGYQSASSATGNKSASSATGDRSASISIGSYAKSEITKTEKHESVEAVACGFGYKNMARACIGSWIVLAERNDDYQILHIKSAKVDGKKIKADTWYKLENGTFKVAE